MVGDTVAGAKSSANLCSLIRTAKANGLEPNAYLRHVLTEEPHSRDQRSRPPLCSLFPALLWESLS
jgi:hypothetical protein